MSNTVYVEGKNQRFEALWSAPGEIRAMLAGRLEKPWDVFVLVGATLLGAGLRAFFLAQPMRFDESYTFLYYLNQGRDPFFYNVPNNHVLHTLLAKLSVLVFGMGPVAIRLPAFLAGVLSIPLMFFVCKAFNRNSGVLAAVASAVYAYLILYSTMARGYSLLVLLTLLLLLAGKYYFDKPSLSGSLLIALISSLGMLTMPSMAFLLAGFYLWLGLALLIRDRDVVSILRGLVIPGVLLTALLTTVFYIPTMISSHGPGTLFSNQFVDPRPWNDFLKHLGPHLQQTLSDFLRDVPRLAQYALLVLALGGWLYAAYRRDWLSFLLLPCLLVGALLVLFWKHAIPFPRTWIYLLPAPLLLADAGYSALVEKLGPRVRLFGALLVFAAGIAISGNLVSGNKIATYTDTGSFPEAATVVAYLKPLLSGNEALIIQDTASYPTYYYLCYDHARRQNDTLDPATVKRYIVVQTNWYTLSDLTRQPATLIFSYGNAEIYTADGGGEPVRTGFVFDCGNSQP